VLADVVDQSLLCQPPHVVLQGVAEQSLFVKMFTTVDDSLQLLLLVLVHHVLALQVVDLVVSSSLLLVAVLGDLDVDVQILII
jgi:hypothetical protein